MAEHRITPFAGESYNTIVIDPPWPMKRIMRSVRDEKEDFDYRVISLSDIRRIRLPLSENSIVFLWTTQKYLPNALSILQYDWRLHYRFTMTWHKNGGFQIWNNPQFNSEFVVVGTKGKPEFLSTKSFNTAFHAKRRGHSVKPEEFYELLRRVTPEPRADIFSRRKIDGFDVWGNEV